MDADHPRWDNDCMTYFLWVVLGWVFVPTDLSDVIRAYKLSLKEKEVEQSLVVLRDLVREYPSADPRDQKELVKVIESTFKSRHEESAEVEALFITASAALGTMGELGPEALLRVARLKHIERQKPVLAVIVEALGDQALPEFGPKILAFLRSSEPLGEDSLVLVGAVRALARYQSAAGDLRKSMVGSMVDLYQRVDEIYRQADQKDKVDDEMDIGFNRLEPALLDALGRLTGRNLRTAGEWKEWFEANRNENWDS